MDDWVVLAGASGDIGQALAATAREQGLKLFALDIVEPPANVDLFRQVDLAGATDGQVSRVASDLGGLNVSYVVDVIGGATVDELKLSDQSLLPMAVARATVELNLLSAIAVMQICLPALRSSSGDRSVTFVSSINALGGYGIPAYSAAKAGLAGLAASYAVPLANVGIRVNAVALGTTRTANFARINLELGRSVDLNIIGGRLPRGRALTPEEVATTTLSLATRCPGVTGQVVVCDGAQSLARRPLD